MNFKEQMEWDAEHIHLNTDEFAEPITWQGDSIDAEIIREGEGEGETYSEDNIGVAVEICTIHVLARLIKRPKAHKAYEFNGDEWMVSRVKSDGPMLIVQVYRDKQ